MRSHFLLEDKNIKTPSFVYNLENVEKKVNYLTCLRKKFNCKVLYSIKVLPLHNILKKTESLDGFSVSSLFEAKLVESSFNEKKNIHFISPAIRQDEWESLSQTVSSLTFNSLEQVSYFKEKLQNQTYGIRVNPQVSVIKDERYNPCRKFSKLGVPLSSLKEAMSYDKTFSDTIEGLHLHTNCESHDFSHLTKTFLRVKESLGESLKSFKWFNLGGGYFFENSKNLSLFYDLLEDLKESYNFQDIIIEPGAFVVKDSGFLVSSVIDLFEREGEKIAILDTTVNHLPEVFEYQYEPDVLGANDSYKNSYILAGSSCLAGDIFGRYSFEEKLQVGSKVVFENVACYSLVKAHTFNGINLPHIYTFEDKIGLQRIKSFTLEEYISHYKGESL